MKLSILEILQEEGKLTEEQVNAVKYESASRNISYETAILEKGLLDEATVAKAKAKSYEIPFIDLAGRVIPPELLSKVDSEVLKRYVAVPIEVKNDKVLLVMADPLDMQAVQSLQSVLGKAVEVYMGLRQQILDLIEKQSGETISSDVTEALEEIGENITTIPETVQDVSQISQELSKAPVARIVNIVLEMAVKLNASDIHIEPEEEGVRIRLRINGFLQEKLRLPKSLKSSLVTRIKILARLKIDEKRIPQDGRFHIKSADRLIDLRISVLPTVYGEKVVIRLLERSEGIPPLETSGLRGSAYKIYLEATEKTTGIMLVTGPTGSGKSRTLAGTLDRLNKPGVNIITVEDPVELRIKGVNQVQVNSEVGLSFAHGLRSILRQDPNIIMVGEVRDEETARLAIQASLTGHLVLTTLHTNNAAGALPRLLDMGIEPYLIASTVHCVVAQRLPRTICQYCIESYVATQEVVNDIKSVLNWKGFSLVKYLQDKSKQNSNADPFASPPRPAIEPPQVGATENDSKIYLYRGKGCEKCDGQGYAGRVGIFEVMRVTDKISKAIMENKTSGDIQRLAIEEGMVTMIQDGYLKAIEGITTLEEVLRVAKD